MWLLTAAETPARPIGCDPTFTSRGEYILWFPKAADALTDGRCC